MINDHTVDRAQPGAFATEMCTSQIHASPLTPNAHFVLGWFGFNTAPVFQTGYKVAQPHLLSQ